MVSFFLPPASPWVKLNAGQFVPHRTLYSEDMLRAISDAMLKGELKSAEDRIGLLLDTYELTRSGHNANAGLVFELLRGYKTEQNSNVWAAVKMVIDGLDRIIQESDVAAQYGKFIADMTRDLAKEIGWDHYPDDTDLAKQQRGLMIGLSATYRASEPDVRQEADRRVRAFLEDQQTALLPDDYKQSCFRVMLKDPDQGEQIWEDLVKITKNPKTQQSHRLAIYGALGHVKSREYKMKTLDETWEIKIQDFFYPFSGVSLSGKEGRLVILGRLG